MELQKLIEQSTNEQYNYPDIFTDLCGLDIVIPEKKLHAVPLGVESWKYNENNKKRKATLEITTFKGISFNAQHYYGKINIQGVDMVHDEDPNRFTMILDDNIPLAHYNYELTLKRPLTLQEINDDPDRWGTYYNEGDLTYCFDKIYDILILAKEVFEKRFVGEWNFCVNIPFKSHNDYPKDFYKFCKIYNIN